MCIRDRFPSRYLLPWPVWAIAATVQLAVPFLFLVRDRVPGRYLVRYPLVTIIALLWLPVRWLRGRVGARWYHTPHEGHDGDA